MNGGGGGGGTQPVPQLDMKTFSEIVRTWVHNDTMLSGFNKQIKNIRDLRNKYEVEIIKLLEQSKKQNEIIQIAGGRLTIAEEKSSQPLSISSLKLLLQKYYRAKPGTKDESNEIMEFIRTQRTVQVSKCIKRKNTGDPPPSTT